VFGGSFSDTIDERSIRTTGLKGSELSKTNKDFNTEIK